MPTEERTCSIDGCAKPSRCRGWCKMHYWRWKRRGDPRKGRPQRDVGERLMSHVRIDPSGCWVWVAALNHKGYGLMSWQGRTRPAHRVSYELLRGPLVEGLEIDHLCRNRACVNPDHLEQVTSQVNTLRRDIGRDADIEARVRARVAGEIMADPTYDIASRDHFAHIVGGES